MGQKFSLEGPPGGRVELAPSIERRSVRIQAQWSCRYPHGFENSVIEIHKVGGGRAHDKSKSAKVGPGTDGTVILNVDLYGQLTPGNDYYLKWKVEDNYPFSGRLLAESASFECVSLKLSAHAGDVDEEVEITCVRSVEERNAEGFRTAIDVDADGGGVDADGGGPSNAPSLGEAARSETLISKVDHIWQAKTVQSKRELEDQQRKSDADARKREKRELPDPPDGAPRAAPVLQASSMSKLDPRLPHRVQEWASTQPNAFVSERDADAIVAWLRAQRGSNYARKPVNGLRKQVVRVIGQLRAPPKASTPGTAEWSIDASPDTAAANSTAGSGSKRSLEAASATAGMVPHLASASKVAKTAAAGGRETVPSGGAGFNLLNASLRASPAVTAAAAAVAAVAAESPAAPLPADVDMGDANEDIDEEMQLALAMSMSQQAGDAVLSRLRGELGQVSIEHGGSSTSRIVAFNSFSTVGSLELLTTSRVAYFEVVILEISSASCSPQLGFATLAFATGDNAPRNAGAGDDAYSWGLDGVRKLKWSGQSSPWACTWAVGDTIGLAANVGMGKIAVSKNGSWTGEGNGVVFTDDAIKQGVYPALTASNFKLRCAFAAADFKYALPPGAVWTAAAAATPADMGDANEDMDEEMQLALAMSMSQQAAARRHEDKCECRACVAEAKLAAAEARAQEAEAKLKAAEKAPPTAVTAAERKKFYEYFKEIDTDSDGLLSVSEIMNYMNGKFGFALTLEQATAMVKEADTDTDGGISFQEFCTILKCAEDSQADAKWIECQAKIGNDIFEKERVRGSADKKQKCGHGGGGGTYGQPMRAPPQAPAIPQGMHPGVECDRSGMKPIVGMRYHLRGHNYDLCQAEYDKLSAGEKGLYEAITPPPPTGSLTGGGGGYSRGGALVQASNAAVEKRRLDELAARNKEIADKLAKQKAEKEAIKAAMARDRAELAARGPAQASIAKKLPTGGSSGGGGGYSGGGGFSLVNPPRYLPSALPQHEQIGVHESAEVKDDTGRFQAGLRAVLDTGNAGCTLITERAAKHLGLVDSHGVPTDYHAHKVNGLRQTVSCRGVVAGAKDVLPALLLSYRIKSKEMKNVVAAVTKADLGADLCAASLVSTSRPLGCTPTTAGLHTRRALLQRHYRPPELTQVLPRNPCSQTRMPRGNSVT
jgi:hypothetical protein